MPEKDTQKYRQRLWKIFLSTLYLSASVSYTHLTLPTNSLV